ncbi:MAG: response regulator transcription factor, partial [Saccharothrix sp.]|nr:response regulator transcription factor [Saccharothrix sp.]
PEVHGDDVCRDVVRGGTATRILMLTAAGTVKQRVEGLGLGADDYLAKPFAYAELVARVQALGRRRAMALPPVLERAGITLDGPRRQAYREGRYLPLSRKEFAVLEVLMQAHGTVVTTEELLERAWDENTDPFTTVVKVTISKLRAKLGAPAVITTVPGGYRL